MKFENTEVFNFEGALCGEEELLFIGGDK